MRVYASLLSIAIGASMVTGCLQRLTPAEARDRGLRTLDACRDGSSISADLCMSLEVAEALYRRCLAEPADNPDPSRCDHSWTFDEREIRWQSAPAPIR